MASDDTSFIPDLPSGPLDEYRKQAKFNWKKMKLVFEEPKYLKIKYDLWQSFEKSPYFQRPAIQPTTEEQKRQTSIRFYHFLKNYPIPTEIDNLPYTKRTRYVMTIVEALYDAFPEISVKYGIGVGLFANTLLTLGTERHRPIYEASWTRKLVACLALTEIAHGSDTKQMRTRATYDKESQEFVINTPDFEAAKCWIGNLGKTATFAMLFAQLYIDDTCHGLHAFAVPIRDPKTLVPYPGIIVGDMGEKVGLNGLDNGFIMFQNYRIPRENLLNRTGDVTPAGEYESSFSEPGKILGAALETLMAGRVGVTLNSSSNLIKAVTIAVRYSAMRKQFSDENSQKEMPIIDYQLQQWRLFPYTAAAAILRIFIDSFCNDYLQAVDSSSQATTRIESLMEMVSEIHSIVSATKPLITWTCQDAVQECREACGGHGYLKATRLGDIRDINDPSVTYEGDNNVLNQQTSNWLMRQWDNAQNTGEVNSPLGTCAFLKSHKLILSKKLAIHRKEDVLKFDTIIHMYQLLIIYLLIETTKKQSEMEKKYNSKFIAKNKTQVYRSAVLSKVYAEYTVLIYLLRKLEDNSIDRDIRKAIEKLGLLYGLWSVEKHLIYFYEGQITNVGPNLIQFVRDGILDLCEGLKGDIIPIIDAIAPPDYILDSVLGKADGKVYQHLQSTLFQTPGAMSRPDWWQDIIIKDQPDFKIKSKL